MSRTNELTPPVSARDHAQGNENAPITLVEYGDYECPACGAAYPIVKELQKQLGDRLRFVFRNFPLAEMLPYAEQAAEAAEAAAAGDKFWEMHDALYENQQKLGSAEIKKYTAEIGLNGEDLARDVAAHKYHARILEDMESGERSGVPGTPTFFINGARHDGSYDFDVLLGALEQAAH